MAAYDERFRQRFEEFIINHGPLLVSSVTVAEVLIGVPEVTRHVAVARAITLVTNNTTDFRRRRRYVGVRAVPPFPAPTLRASRP